MANCNACGAWFSSTAPDELCPTCERALKRLNGYAVPVVRCKDCKHYTPDKKHPWNDETGYDLTKFETLPFGYCCGQDFVFTEDGELNVHENDFCANGERREGE